MEPKNNFNILEELSELSRKSPSVDAMREMQILAQVASAEFSKSIKPGGGLAENLNTANNSDEIKVGLATGVQQGSIIAPRNSKLSSFKNFYQEKPKRKSSPKVKLLD